MILSSSCQLLYDFFSNRLMKSSSSLYLSFCSVSRPVKWRLKEWLMKKNKQGLGTLNTGSICWIVVQLLMLVGIWIADYVEAHYAVLRYPRGGLTKQDSLFLSFPCCLSWADGPCSTLALMSTWSEKKRYQLLSTVTCRRGCEPHADFDVRVVWRSEINYCQKLLVVQFTAIVRLTLTSMSTWSDKERFTVDTHL
jgi:hypothetical protein